MTRITNSRKQSLPGESLCCCMSCSSLIQISIISCVFIIAFLPAIGRIITSAGHEMPSMSENVVISPPLYGNFSNRSKGSKENSSNAIVILFGWPDASDSKMARYSKMYSSHGYTTVRYTAPWNYNFINGERIPKVAQDFYQFFTNQDEFKKQFVFFHVFSNLGCSMYQNILIQVDSRNDMNIKGRYTKYKPTILKLLWA